MPRRRAKLTTALAAGGLALLASPQAHAGTNNIGLPTIPLTVINNTATGSDIYITIIGLVGSTWYSVIDANGDVQAAPATTAVRSYSIDVGSAPQASVNIPRLVGARLYVSIGKPLLLPGGNGTPGAPAGWVSSDPNYNTNFDWIEYTWVPGPGSGSLGGNTTQVDMFGLALTMSLTGDGGTLQSGADTNPSDYVWSYSLGSLQRLNAPWSSLLVYDPNGRPLRAISPYHGIENNVFPANALQPYLDQAFSSYPNGGLSTTSVGASFTGRTSGGSMIFTNTANGASFQIQEPTTYGAYTGSFGANPAPSDPALAQQAAQIVAQLQATLLRTALLADGGNLLACNTQNFYQTGPVDQYAKIMHQFALSNKTYGFGFDDVCGQSSYINVNNPTGMTLSIGPIGPVG